MIGPKPVSSSRMTAFATNDVVTNMARTENITVLRSVAYAAFRTRPPSEPSSQNSTFIDRNTMANINAAVSHRSGFRSR